jgi:hypothetical protein
LSGALWLFAVAAGVLPRRYWQSLEQLLPLRRAASLSGLATLVAGFFLGVGGFFTFATRLAGANNDWLLARLAGPPANGDAAAGLVPYGMSVLTFFIFVFFTPIGLLALYLTTSGALRAIAGFFDDPHGDPLLTGLDWAIGTLLKRNREERRRTARERLEGAERPDVLQTGAWAGLADTDYVVLSSRRKAEWEPGAIILTSTDWYRLGVPFDMKTPAGLRTAYPLKKMATVEVVRRGIQYELPRLQPQRKSPAGLSTGGAHEF